MLCQRLKKYLRLERLTKLSRVAFVNGQYCDFSNSLVHIEDRGYQFADGVYEVFTILDGKIVDYKPHMERLFRSLSELEIKSPIARKTFILHIKNIIKKNLITNGNIYLQITRGVTSRDFKYPKNLKSSIVIVGKIIPDIVFRTPILNGIKVITTKDLRWKRCDIKSINLLAPVIAKQKANDSNATEAWLVDDNGFITEGSSSSAWILDKNETLITASLKNNILPGITRQSLIKGLIKRKVKFKEKSFNINDIKNAKEAFITSATTFVTPVIKVDNIKIGKGKPGKFAPVFFDIYRKSINLAG